MINSHESRFNLFGLLTNSTQRICLVASGECEPVTFKSQNPTLSRYTTHLHCFKYNSFSHNECQNLIYIIRVDLCVDVRAQSTKYFTLSTL